LDYLRSIRNRWTGSVLDQFNRLTAFVLLCAACLLGANSASDARSEANDHAAQTTVRSTGSLESLRFLIGRWVKNQGAGEEEEEEWADIDFGQLEGLRREWQGQRLISQSRIVVYSNGSGIGAYLTEDFPNSTPDPVKTGTVTSSRQNQMEIRFGTNAEPHLAYNLKASGELQLVTQAQGSQKSFVLTKTDGHRAMDTKPIEPTFNYEMVRRRLDLFSKYWLTGSPAKPEEGCVGIPSFTYPPGFPYGPVAFVSHVPTESEAAKVYAAGKSEIGRIEVGDDVCTGVHVGDGLFLTSAHGVGEMQPGKGYVPRSTIKVNGFRADFLAADPGADVALLSVKQQANLPCINVGPTANLRHDQIIYTIGFPAKSQVPLMFCERMQSLTVNKRPRSYTDPDTVDGLIVKSKVNGTFSGFSGGPMFYVDPESNKITLAGIHLGEESDSTLRGAPVEHMVPLIEALNKSQSPPILVSSQAHVLPGDKGFEVHLLRFKPVNSHAPIDVRSID
jgi:S1-C subfamily serine protease